MGIKSFLKFIKKEHPYVITDNVNISDVSKRFGIRRVAIDTSGLFFRFFCGSNVRKYEDANLVFETIRNSMFHKFIQTILLFKKNNIESIFVFDGGRIEEKTETYEKRDKCMVDTKDAVVSIGINILEYNQKHNIYSDEELKIIFGHYADDIFKFLGKSSSNIHADENFFIQTHKSNNSDLMNKRISKFITKIEKKTKKPLKIISSDKCENNIREDEFVCDDLENINIINSMIESFVSDARKIYRLNDVDTYELFRILDIFNIPYIVAKNEAEIYAAKLEENNIVDAIISEDSDCFPAGSNLQIKNININTGRLSVYDWRKFKKENGFDDNGGPVNLAQKYCVSIGCDFLPKGIMGFGPKTGLTLLNKDSMYIDNKICEMDKKERRRFKDAINIFTQKIEDGDMVIGSALPMIRSKVFKKNPINFIVDNFRFDRYRNKKFIQYLLDEFHIK